MNKKWRENMKKIILSTMLIMASVFPFVAHTEAAKKTSSVKQSATINANHVNIRKGAGTNYHVITQLSKGKKVEIIKSYKNKKKQIWYNIKFSGKNGWVISKYVKRPVVKVYKKTAVKSKTPAKSTKKPAIIMIVGTKNAVLYSGASLNDQKIDRLPTNSKVTVLSEFINQSTMQVWEKIKLSSGKIGWTPKYELVSSIKDLRFVYTMKNSPFYEDEQSQKPVRNSFVENEKVNVLADKNGKLYVETKRGVRGWVLKAQTSSATFRRLLNPRATIVGNDTHIIWDKPSNFKFTYKTEGSNKLLLSQGFTYAQLPQIKIKGIKEVKTLKVKKGEKAILVSFDPGYTFTIRNNSNTVSIKVTPTGLIGKKIIVDAGHGGKDPGAIGPSRIKEKNINLSTALRVKKELEKAGAIVTLTRSTDVFLELSERTAIANSSDYDAFISIHSDNFSKTSKGTTTYYNSDVNFNGPRSLILGKFVQKNLVDSINTYNRGVKHQRFYVNRMNELPSILVELAFISNPKEEALLNSSKFQKKAAVGIRKGFEEYFNRF
jgi:N-acetylmuramoyl-L-alanine amidase